MYSKSITRSSRALFVIAIDQSGSMAGVLKTPTRTLTKAEMVAEVANDLIAELVERSRRGEGVRDYYDVALVGYSGEGASSLLGKSWLTTSELDKSCQQESYVERQYRLYDGQTRFFRFLARRWVMPKATGATPMYESLLLVHDIVEQWCAMEPNYESFPPIIFNITDGESTDGNYDDIVQISSKIKSLSTHDGNALLINIHIASDLAQESLLFPSEREFEQWHHNSISRSASALYNAASDLPPIFAKGLCDLKDLDHPDRFKAISFNTSPTELITILNIGSITLKRG